MCLVSLHLNFVNKALYRGYVRDSSTSLMDTVRFSYVALAFIWSLTPCLLVYCGVSVLSSWA